MQAEPYRLEMPRDWSTSVIFASPHSGAVYPEDFMQRTILCRPQIRSSEDAFVDTLFAAAPGMGAPLLAATAPRAFVDLNRAPDELDSALVSGIGSSGSNPRVSSGLGVIPRVVANGRAIYRGKIPLQEARERLKSVWFPYHDRLSALVDSCRAQFGEAILIDCHSMPHEAIDAISRNGKSPDIVLGDRFGASADPAVVDLVETSFAALGLKVARNSPFAGAYTAQAYGRPCRGQHVVQIEIDRALYMDEDRIEPNANFGTLRDAVSYVIGEITDYGRSRTAMAAE